MSPTPSQSPKTGGHTIPRRLAAGLLVAALITAGVIAAIYYEIEKSVSGPSGKSVDFPASLLVTLLPLLISAAAVWLLRRRAGWEWVAAVIICQYAVTWTAGHASTGVLFTPGFDVGAMSSPIFGLLFGTLSMLLAFALWAAGLIITALTRRTRSPVPAAEAPVTAPVAAPEAVARAHWMLAVSMAAGAVVFFCQCLIVHLMAAETLPHELAACAVGILAPGLLAAGLFITAARTKLSAGAAMILSVVAFIAAGILGTIITGVTMIVVTLSLSGFAYGLIIWWVLSALLRLPSPWQTGRRTETGPATTAGPAAAPAATTASGPVQ